MNGFLAQAIGFLAVAAFIVSYQVKSNRKLFFFQMIGCLLFCIQFFLLGAASGCLSLGVNLLRSALLLQYSRWTWVRWRGLAVIFCAIYGIILAAAWAGPVSLLAFFASAVSTLGYWHNNARTIRLANLFCASPCWLLYDICVHSWGGVVNEAITIASILLSAARFGWKALGDPDSEFQR